MNALKKIARIVFLLIAFISVSSELAAQRRVVINKPKYDLEPYHFGFILAVNQMMLTWKPVDNYQLIQWIPEEAKDLNIPTASHFRVMDITSLPVPGFAVGIVGNLRLGNYFDLRFIPTLAFGERYIDYTVEARNITWQPIDTVIVRKSIPSTTVDFPFHIKYRSKRLNNFAAYVLAGAKYSIEMASTKKVSSANNNVPVKVDRNDFAAEAGVGFDFYTPYFKFGTELKMSYGFKNILVRDEFLYSQALDRINNKVFQLSFTFE